MQISKYRFILLLCSFRVDIGIISNFLQYLFPFEDNTVLISIVNKPGITVVGNPPDPGIKRIDLIFVHPIKDVTNNLTCKILGIMAIR